MTPADLAWALAYTKRNEGCSLTARKDRRGWMIGYGHNTLDVCEGQCCTQAQADTWAATDHARALRQASIVLGPGAWGALDGVRQAVLADMAYELGGVGLGGFHHMLAAIVAQAWPMAHDALLDSDYAHQVPARAQRNAQMLLTGIRPALNF